MSSARTKIQTETKKKGPPRNLQRGELAYNEIEGLLYIGSGPENRGNARKKIVVAGQEFSIPASSKLTEAEIKEILRIQGDAVGTFNDQELHSKTLNGGFF
tara:strand:+ start:17320 stop:17622 length:303 start_codon:yes stop_codon:yes gene_type:complete